MTSPKPTIFISYRRDDEPFAALWICRELERAFGAENVFLDTHLQHGNSLSDEIRSRIEGAQIVIAIVGEKWAGTPRSQHGQRRLHDPSDWIRLEVSAALKLKKCVLPFLIGEAEQPIREDLPEDLRGMENALSRRLIMDSWRPALEELCERIHGQTSLPFNRAALCISAKGEIEDAYRETVMSAHRRLLGKFQELQLERIFVDPGLKAECALPASVDLGTLSGVIEAMRDPSLPRHWLVYGDPGGGKTTLVRRVSLMLAESPDSPLPVYVSLPRYAKSEEGSWSKRLADSCSGLNCSKDELAHAFARWARLGRLVVLLDGFDEVAESDHGTTIDAIEKLAVGLGASPLFVTCRWIGRETLSARCEGFGQISVEPLLPTQQKNLLEKRLGSSWTTTWGRIAKSPGLQRLASNPLMLSFMAHLAMRNKAIPDRVHTLHDAIITDILEVGWKEGEIKEASRFGEHELAREVLTAVAYELQCLPDSSARWSREQVIHALRQIGSPELRKRFDACGEWDGHGDFVAQLKSNGLFSEKQGVGTGYQFLHRTLGESLAANELRERIRKKAGIVETKALAKKLAGAELARWAETFAIFVERSDEPEKWLRELRDVNPELARRALAWVDGISEELVAELLELPGDDVDRRCNLYGQVARIVGNDAGAARILGRLAAATADTQDLWFITSELLRLEGLPDGETKHAAELALEPANLFKQFGAPIELSTLRVPGHPKAPYWVEINGCQAAKDLRVAAVPITNYVWSKFMKGFDPEKAFGGPDAPVTEVSWYAAVMFCRWLGKDVHLPTSSIREFACRAASTSEYCFGDDESKLGEYAWYGENSEGQIHTVATREPNDWGLFDMHGNVVEWCADQLGSSARVFGGGSWDAAAWWCRSSYRYAGHPDVRYVYLGFRPARFVTDPLYSFTSAAVDEDELEPNRALIAPMRRKTR